MDEQRSLNWGADFVMSHTTTGMTGMWDPSKRFGEIITGIENPRKMFHDKIFLLAQFLNGKMLDVKVGIDLTSGTILTKSGAHADKSFQTLGTLPSDKEDEEMSASANPGALEASNS